MFTPFQNGIAMKLPDISPIGMKAGTTELPHNRKLPVKNRELHMFRNSSETRRSPTCHNSCKAQ